VCKIHCALLQKYHSGEGNQLFTFTSLDSFFTCFYSCCSCCSSIIRLESGIYRRSSWLHRHFKEIGKLKNIKDDQGNNQIWGDTYATRIRAERRCEMFVAEISGQNNRILEIGCGIGKNAYCIAKKTNNHVLGTDICLPFIEHAKKEYQLPNLAFEVTDFNNPDQISGRKFDYIIGNGILHHLYYHLDAVLDKFKELLSENGKIIFIEPNLYNPYIALIFKIIYKKLINAGFSDVKVKYKDFLLPGIPKALVKPSIIIGNVVEKTPFIKNLSQSIFIEASYHSSN